jgi:hypothetical protein
MLCVRWERGKGNVVQQVQLKGRQITLSFLEARPLALSLHKTAQSMIHANHYPLNSRLACLSLN